MIFGLNLPNYSRLGNRESMIVIAEQAEQLGYSSLWTNDHILIPADRPEPFGNVLAIRVLFESDHPEYHGRHINFSEALFSPRPDPPIPIVIGGSSQAALKRAATLGDGWYGLRLSPDAASAATGVMNQIGHKPDFTLSLRVQTRVGGSVEDADPATSLHGDPDAIVDRIGRYREAGIEQLVIEPVTSSLDDFRQQIRLFAREVASRYIHR